MTDVFDRLVGQDRVAASLRQYALAPVHAFLFSGPAGSSVRDALLCFAAALQCPRHGCGECEICRLVLSEQDPDVHFAERSGVSWRIEEIREAERVSRRRPLGAGYQIVVLEDIELTTTGASVSAPALLKSLEEPPPRTIFLLSAEELPDALDTVASRCVDVKLRALSETDLRTILESEGASAEVARDAAAAATGNSSCPGAVRDSELATRTSSWRSVPERLTGTPAASSRVAKEIAESLDEAIAPLQRLQEEELERRASDAREMGLRSAGNRRDIDAQFKREQASFPTRRVAFWFQCTHRRVSRATAGEPRGERRGRHQE